LSARERKPENPVAWLDTPQALIVLGMVDAEILAYDSRGLERDRLASGRQRIEFLRIWDLLEHCLPAATATVVDVGGGAGAYAIPPASAGYKVHLIDPVPLHIEQATEASRQAGTPLASISAGDTRELPTADDSADAVLLLGPLYHLTSREDRITSERETIVQQVRIFEVGDLAHPELPGRAIGKSLIAPAPMLSPDHATRGGWYIAP
jgi:hypothetical protein